MTHANRFKPLAIALEDHSAEGIALLTAEPWRFTRALVISMAALVVCALIWSFIGRVDVIVSAPGGLQPDSEVRRFYAPIDGELANLYIAEGQPVNKGDVVARLNARGAVEAAANAVQAQLKLEDAEREWKQFPERKSLLEKRVATLKQAMELEEHQHERRLREGNTTLTAAFGAQFRAAQTQVDEARRARTVAQEEADKFARLFATPGGGGIAQVQVDAKRNALQAADSSLRLSLSRLSELAAQQNLSSSQAKSELERSGQELNKLRLQYEAAAKEVSITEEKLRLQLQAARLAAEAAARIKFENIDQDNFLLVVAPESGIVTDVTSTQPGDKLNGNTPLGGIAPAGAKPVLKIEIAERDRAFLREGLPAKLKFNAFPYQRHGLITGTLEYISPSTKPSAQNKQPIYEGRITLDRDHYEIADTRYPLRYGMAATAEVVVRERRVIDLALDPFRQVGG